MPLLTWNKLNALSGLEGATDYERWNHAYGGTWFGQTVGEQTPITNFTSGYADPLSSTDGKGAAWAKNIGYGAAILSGLEGYKQAKNYEAQAKAAESNAALTRQQIDQVGKAAGRESNAYREKGQRMIGSARAAYGASGVDSNTGSAGAVQDAMAYRAERDARTSLQNAAINQWALGNEAAQYDAQAQSYRNMAKEQKRSSLLNTALAIAKIYYGVGV